MFWNKQKSRLAGLEARVAGLEEWVAKERARRQDFSEALKASNEKARARWEALMRPRSPGQKEDVPAGQE